MQIIAKKRHERSPRRRYIEIQADRHINSPEPHRGPLVPSLGDKSVYHSYTFILNPFLQNMMVGRSAGGI